MWSTRAPLTEPTEDVMGHGEHAGAAKRRRERRLRAMLRHERMTVAMVLSEKKHHTSRGQNKDRTTGEENVMNYTAKLGKTPPPTAAATEYDPMVLDEGGALAAAAAGGTAGGSTDDRVIFLVSADYGADRGHSSSAGWWATRRSSRFSPRTEFHRCRADR